MRQEQGTGGLVVGEWVMVIFRNSCLTSFVGARCLFATFAKRDKWEERLNAAGTPVHIFTGRLWETRHTRAGTTKGNNVVRAEIAQQDPTMSIQI